MLHCNCTSHLKRSVRTPSCKLYDEGCGLSRARHLTRLFEPHLDTPGKNDYDSKPLYVDYTDAGGLLVVHVSAFRTRGQCAFLATLNHQMMLRASSFRLGSCDLRSRRTTCKNHVAIIDSSLSTLCSNAPAQDLQCLAELLFCFCSQGCPLQNED